jgi:hypothetical protein
MARRSPNSNRPVRPSSTPAKRKGIPLSPLAQQMLQDLQLAGLSDRTHESYLRAVRKFAQWLKKSPDQASENELRRYLLFIKNDQQYCTRGKKEPDPDGRSNDRRSTYSRSVSLPAAVCARIPRRSGRSIR